MPVLVTCKFDEDPINNKHASVETSFSPLKVYEIFSGAQGHVTLK